MIMEVNTLDNISSKFRKKKERTEVTKETEKLYKCNRNGVCIFCIINFSTLYR